MTTLRRNFSTGCANTDLLLDQLCAASGKGGSTTVKVINNTGATGGGGSAPSSGGRSSATTNDAPAIVTRGIITFLKGDVVGISGGKHVRAQAGVTRGILVCTGNSSPGAALQHVSSGTAWVFVESGITPALGDPAYLSAKQPGSVTNAQPSAGTQLIGVFHSTLVDGRAIVQLHIDLSIVDIPVATDSGSGSDSAGATSDEPVVVVVGTTAFSEGDVVGILSGEHVLALAGTSAASCVCVLSSAPGSTLFSRSYGSVWVSVETGITPALGDPAYLSPNEAGRATNVEPAAMQLIGQFMGAKTNGKALMQLSIDLATRKTL
jgi:hypothetical protein